MKCLLEDGILLATEEQLLAFNIEPTGELVLLFLYIFR